jgi:hypothetical protein
VPGSASPPASRKQTLDDVNWSNMLQRNTVHLAPIIVVVVMALLSVVLVVFLLLLCVGLVRE